jgi:HAD superfamily hydrolase (TIGR01484 family)
VKPIRELTSERVRGLRGVCFDIDDTVTTHGVLDVAAYAALAELRAQGLMLIAVTGRPLGFAEIVARTWCVDAAVGENGAGYIARRPQGMKFGYWDDEATRLEQSVRLGEIRQRVARELPHVRLSSDSWARRCDLAFDVNEEAQLASEDVDALVHIIEGAGANASVSSVHAHAQLGDHDKARGVVRAAQELFDLEADQVQNGFLFVGDSGNDAAAFAWFGVTVGVANVRDFLPRLPVHPEFVTEAARGGGFAELAHVLLELRRA